MENTGFEYSIRSKLALRSCFVYGCFSTAAATNKTIGFHKFPRRGKRDVVVTKKNGDKSIYDRRQLWIEALSIGRKASRVIDQLDIYVCSLHFSRQDYYYNQDLTGKRYLKELAIPRRNLPARYSSPLTVRFNVRHLNRIRFRGYFNIHNPDGRKLTAPRRFLGANKAERLLHESQSFPETVLVVRKPEEPDQPEQEDLTGVGHISVSSTFSLAGADQECLNQATTNGVFSEEDFKAAYGTIDEDDNSQEFDQTQLVVQTEDDLRELNVEGAEFEGYDGIQAEVVYDDATTEAFAAESGDYYENNAGESSYGENGYQEANEAQVESDYYENNTGESSYGENGYQEANEAQVFYDKYNGQKNDLFYKICRTCGALNCPGHRKRTTKENVFVCLICSDVFSSQRRLDRHNAAYHCTGLNEEAMAEEEKANLTCGFCGRVLSTKSTLREHIMIHTGEKPHECKLCGKSFRHKANLVVHVNGHVGVGGYKCKKCNEAFTKKSEFEKHLQVHVDPSGTPLVCRICDGVFKSQRTLHNHSILHEKQGFVNRKKRRANGGDPKFTCPTCQRQLSTKATLKEHMMIHSGERPHECPYCGRMIRHKANFVMHIQTHGQGKSYECDMCDQAFMRKADLHRHKQTSHATAKVLRCAICAEVFKSPLKFNRHMEMHESIAYINETEELTGYQPHLLEGFLETDDGVLDL